MSEPSLPPPWSFSQLNLLVAVDASPFAGFVLQSANAFLRVAPQAKIHLVHVVETVPASAIAMGGSLSAVPAITELLVQGQNWLDRLVTTLKAPEGASVETHLEIGDPSGRILTLAHALHSTMVMVGTHDPKGLQRLLFGSVASAVARDAPCAVFIVRQPTTAAELVVPPIEPLCPACAELRLKTGNPLLWCERHSHHHPRAHTYSTTIDRYGVGSMTFRDEKDS